MKILSIFVFALILSSCAGFTRSEQPARPDLTRIGQNQKLGQSFIARYDGLELISVFIKPVQDSTGDVTLSLYEEIDSIQPKRSSSLLSSDIKVPGRINFQFDPIQKSAGEGYYFELEFNGEGDIRVGSAPGNSYLSGAQYLDGIPQNSQSTFSLGYSASQMLAGLFLEGISWIGYLLLGLFLFAQLSGLVSQVPGGLGVFETVIVLLLSSRIPVSNILASLLVYRFFLLLASPGCCNSTIWLARNIAKEKTCF